MEPIVKQAHNNLLKKRLTVAVAESCTGGLLSTLLTQLSGSSAYLLLGVVAYSNKAKEKLLKIPRGVITANGAVSKEVALLMAKNVKSLIRSDIGIGITGIAGPTGGTKDKPVGTVCIALASKKITLCHKFIFKGSRDSVRKKSALRSLELLNKIIA